jgi:hypothetical protein
MVTRLIAVLVLTAAVLAPLAAQETTAAMPATTQSFDFKAVEVQTALATIARDYGVRVIGQDGLKGSVTAKATSATLESALTMITAPNKLNWRTFVLAVKPSDQVTAKTLGDLMSALDAITFAGLLSYDPGQTDAVRVERGVPTAGVIGSAGPGGSVYTPFYYVYSAKPKTQPPKQVAERPAERGPARGSRVDLSVGEVMVWFSGLSPQVRNQILRDLARMNEMTRPGPGDQPQEEGGEEPQEEHD